MKLTTAQVKEIMALRPKNLRAGRPATPKMRESLRYLLSRPKPTKKQLEKIRYYQDYLQDYTPHKTTREIAAQYGISQNLVFQIWSGRRRKHDRE